MKKLLFLLILPAVFSCTYDEEILPDRLIYSSEEGFTRFNNILLSERIGQLPYETPSPAERSTLLFMIEEEKLARDVYDLFYETWRKPIFDNIAASEENHMYALRVLLNKYAITDPSLDYDAGHFQNQELRELYLNLTTKGQRSYEKALEMGAMIEEMGIADLILAQQETDKQDINLLYDHLQSASANHLRIFYNNLREQGITYRPRYITQDLLQEIVNAPTTTGY